MIVVGHSLGKGTGLERTPDIGISNIQGNAATPNIEEDGEL